MCEALKARACSPSRRSLAQHQAGTWRCSSVMGLLPGALKGHGALTHTQPANSCRDFRCHRPTAVCVGSAGGWREAWALHCQLRARRNAGQSRGRTAQRAKLDRVNVSSPSHCGPFPRAFSKQDSALFPCCSVGCSPPALATPDPSLPRCPCWSSSISCSPQRLAAGLPLALAIITDTKQGCRKSCSFIPHLFACFLEFKTFPAHLSLLRFSFSPK